MQSYGNNKLNKICIKSIKLLSAQAKKKNDKEINKTKEKTNLQFETTFSRNVRASDLRAKV